MLFGKLLVITGVASGIGARTAALAAQLGADVIGVDLRPPAQPVGDFIAADLGRPDAIAELVQHLPTRLDALCNVAGVAGNQGLATTLAINFYGLRALTEAVAPLLREGGAVVNVASIAGFGWRANLERARALVDVPGFPADIAALAARHGAGDAIGYPLSKELLLLWTFRAAHEERFRSRGIRVNAVSPGPVETPILTQFRAVLGDARVDSDINRVGRAGTAGDVAPAIAFLCSDAARWINGCNLPVDGGLEASINADVLGFGRA
jgi:NAD(P)-dependent dehydrogenase (short-subunit alcohol dehydrogenase family)